MQGGQMMRTGLEKCFYGTANYRTSHSTRKTSAGGERHGVQR